MFQPYRFTVKERFLRYVQMDTQSDPQSDSFPSSEKQKELGRLLVGELLQMGIADAHLDEFGYVYATIASTTDKEVPVICFCSHMDTSPDCSGMNVMPIVHEKYDGSPIVLPDDLSQIITTHEHPYLLERIGDDIITASGTTLLGADDKAGVAIIMDMANYVVTHHEFKHGSIKLLFTPDEEIGKGVNHVNLQKLRATVGYTLDGGERGSLEDENFSADGVTIVFYGVSAHPGQAKNKMVNAVKVAAAFIESLPKNELSPESTADRSGFVHPVQLDGIAEKATLRFIIRDFVTSNLLVHEKYLRHKLQEALALFPGATATFAVEEQYRNMKEIMDKHPEIILFAREAIERAGCIVRGTAIRGGTDGARLSFIGLPCPNIFTGEMALHGKHEYVSVQDMQKSVETILNLVSIWEEKAG